MSNFIGFFDLVFFSDLEQQPPSASVSAISDSGKMKEKKKEMACLINLIFYHLDAVVDPSLTASTLLNKSASDLLSFAHLSSSQTPISSSISTINAQTLPTVSQVR